MAERTGMAYRLFDHDRGFTLMESAEPLNADAFEVNATVFNRLRQLRTSPAAGWLKHTVALQDAIDPSVPEPTWQAPLMALGVVCAVALGAAMLAMLVQRHLHQTLIQVSRESATGGLGQPRRDAGGWLSHSPARTWVLCRACFPSRRCLTSSAVATFASASKASPSSSPTSCLSPTWQPRWTL